MDASRLSQQLERILFGGPGGERETNVLVLLEKCIVASPIASADVMAPVRQTLEATLDVQSWDPDKALVQIDSAIVAAHRYRPVGLVRPVDFLIALATDPPLAAWLAAFNLNTEVIQALASVAERGSPEREPTGAPVDALDPADEGFGALLRVVGVGRVLRSRGIEVELLAIEERVAGTVLHWKAASHDGVSRQLGDPDIEVRDRSGRRHRAFMIRYSTSGSAARGEAGVTGLQSQTGLTEVVFHTFRSAFTGAVAAGPWSFSDVQIRES